MFDKMTEKLMAMAATSYMPKLDQMTTKRRNELEQMKSKIVTNPEEVQAWFEKEIRKIETINVGDWLTNLKDELK